MINEGYSYASDNPWSFGSQVSSDGVIDVDARWTEPYGLDRIADARPLPIPMILTCPACGERHIDEGQFATKPHHTHACQHCGLPWRPAIVTTVGVRFLPGFKDAVE